MRRRGASELRSGEKRLLHKPNRIHTPRVPDEANPPRKVYALKPKEFERVNAPRPEAGEPSAPPPLANDIFTMQRDLREREIASGMDVLKPADRPRTKRRRRDYWLLMLVGNIAIVGTAALVGWNIMTVVYALAGVILYAIGLTWVMWFVMGDY